MILVTGTLDIDPDARKEFIAATQELMTATRAEAGCAHYAFSADLDDDGRFYVAERWESEEAMGAHMAQPHFAAFLGTVGGMIRGTDVVKWTGATPEKLF